MRNIDELNREAELASKLQRLATRLEPEHTQDLEWWARGGGSRQGSSAGAALESRGLYAARNEDCPECGGTGSPVPKRRRQPANGSKPTGLVAVAMKHLAEAAPGELERATEVVELTLDQGSDAESTTGVCAKCRGSGARFREGPNGRNGNRAGPLMGGTDKCKPCRGVAGRTGCPQCRGEGFVWLDLVGRSQSAQQGGSRAHDANAADIGRAGEIERRIAFARTRFAPTRRVFFRYHGDLGALEGDPLLALYPETPAGREIIELPRPDNVTVPMAIRLAVSDASSTSWIRQGEARTLARQAGHQALELLWNSNEAWNWAVASEPPEARAAYEAARIERENEAAERNHL